MKLVVNVVAVVVVVVMVVMVGNVMGEGVRADPPCNPNPDCSGHGLGEKVEDPQNCTNFYICVGEGIVANEPSQCGEGEFFDATVSECKTMTTPCKPKCSGNEGSGVCNLRCGEGLTFASDPFDCSKYYACLPGGTQQMSCPNEHIYFNGEECGDDPTECCVPACDPLCETANTLIPDPMDCTRFYFCEAEGTPDENYHYTCTDGSFDVHLSECTSSTTCSNLCEGGTGSPGGTTPSSSGCVETLMCQSQGLFPACSDCQPPYFSCSGPNQPGVLNSCTGGRVFNIVPEYAFCVNNCPYYPKSLFSFFY